MSSHDGPRIDPLPPDEWSELLRRVLEGMPGGLERPMNVFTTLARHPDLFEAWIRFGGRLLMGGLIPARDRELAILRTAHNCSSPYEWAQHVPLARASGIEDEEIEALRRPLDEHAWADEDRLLLAAADELHSTSNLSDETWGALSRHYDERQLIELPMLVGHYVMLAGALNSLRVQVEDG
jgi:alkylhydroperoxidase family enzyme